MSYTIADIVVSRDDSFNDSLYTANINYWLYLLIGLVYAVLLSLIVDRLMRVERVYSACNDANSKFGTKEYDQANKLCRDVSEKHNQDKFMYMIFLGLFSMFSGAYLARYCDDYLVAGSGVSFGGSLLIVYYTFLNWNRLNLNAKIGIFTLSLVALVTYSVYGDLY